MTSTTFTSSECSICCDSIYSINEYIDGSDKTLFKTSCGHIFHYSCIQTWVSQKNTCPMCRHPNIFDDHDDDKTGITPTTQDSTEFIYDTLLANPNLIFRNIDNYIQNIRDNIHLNNTADSNTDINNLESEHSNIDPSLNSIGQQLQIEHNHTYFNIINIDNVLNSYSNLHISSPVS
tara:strand:+ start:173 stop:703 length:531 start_codon:yes stop_codon:yes gene_type:complete